MADENMDVLTKTTLATGKTHSLYLNKDILYQLKETQAPDGYQQDSVVRYSAFSENNPPEGTRSEGTIMKKSGTYTAPVVIKDKLRNGQGEGTYPLSFVKLSDDADPVLGAAFALTGTNLQAEEATSDEDGSIKFEDIDPGTHELKESSVPSGSGKTGGAITVTITTSDQLAMTDDDFLRHSDEMGYTVTSTRIRETVTLWKQGSTDPISVPGTKFTVYSKPGGVVVAYLTGGDVISELYQLSALEVPAKDAVGNWYLSADNQLIMGGYYLKKTTTPAGYLPDTDKQNKLHSYDFSITSQGQAVTVSNDGSATDFYNVPIGSIVGQEVVVSSGLPLVGATIGLFNAAETNLIKGKVIATVSSENDGSFIFSDLLYGTYKIAETVAPGRYLVNASVVFTVMANRDKQSITTDDSSNAILIANTRRFGGDRGGGDGSGNPGDDSNEGYTVIQRSSGDGVFSGFTSETTDGNTYTKHFVTDADGRIMTDELLKGTYIVREVAEEGMTDRHELPKAQIIRISGVGTKLNFENKLLPEFIPPDEVPLGGGGGTEPFSPVEEVPGNGVPKGAAKIFGSKTGYTGALPLWVLVLGLSLAGLGCSVISLPAFRRKGRHVDRWADSKTPSSHSGTHPVQRSSFDFRDNLIPGLPASDHDKQRA